MEGKKFTKNKSALRSAAKSSSNRLHVVPTMDGWSVKREGASRASRVFKTKQEALTGANSIKQKSSIVVHKRDGTIEQWAR